MQKIMILEDSSLIRLRITNLLKAHGYNHYVTFGSADAIVRNPNLHLENVDLILADLKLPGISGIEFLKSLRALPEYRHIPILIMGLRNDVKAIGEMVAAGASDFLVKPFDDNALMEKIKKHLADPQGSNDLDDQSHGGTLRMHVALEYERSIRGKLPFSVIHLSVDHQAISAACRLLKEYLRKIDQVCHWQKRIFLVLPITPQTGSEVVLQRLLSALSDHQIMIQGYGLLTFDPAEGMEFDALMSEIEKSARKVSIL